MQSAGRVRKEVLTVSVDCRMQTTETALGGDHAFSRSSIVLSSFTPE